MIFDQNTVLVLGAGASSPYKFPLGRKLKPLIVDNTKKGKSKHRSHFLAAGFSENDIDEFHADLARSVNTTIDSFLEDRPSRRKIAAFAIASALVPLESEDSLFPPTDWYPILFKELALRGDYGEPTVSAIITFNYDRSLEHYLTETAKRTYENDQRVRALNTLARLPTGALRPKPKQRRDRTSSSES